MYNDIVTDYNTTFCITILKINKNIYKLITYLLDI